MLVLLTSLTPRAGRALSEANGMSISTNLNPWWRHGAEAMPGDGESAAAWIWHIRGVIPWRPGSWSDAKRR